MTADMVSANLVKKKGLLAKIKAMGPGAIITASFIGPGTVTTATRAGAGFGYAILWAVVFSIIATIVLQEMSARLGVITQKGLGEAIHDQFKQPLLKFASIWLVIISIGVGCAAYISGDLMGTSLGISTLTSIPANVVSPFIGVAILFLGLSGSYKLIEKLMITLVVIMSLTFITTMIVVKPDLGAVFSGAFVPSMPAGSIIMIIALVGTTVVPYNFFIHSSMVQERWTQASDLKEARWDTIISICVGGLITAAVLITAGTTMYGMEVNSVADLSYQLEPLFGSWAKVFIAIGIFAAGFSSAIASPLGAAVAISSVMKWENGMKNKKFKMVFASVIIIGIITSAIGFSPMDVLLMAQALNGILLPVVAIFLFVIMNNKKLLGDKRNSVLLNIIGAVVILIATFLGGYSLLDAIQTYL
ncbi:Nramp family divalent metal transporter [Mammaliicoccus sciuri]|uniref:NRAMP (Natural resistance-associated macrophage protein) metal ion transporters n=2 Tax=Sporosarcina newyorkensis TaxID=759851 RepID=A0A1T4Y8N3_9BACL|nr:Nramp family divalent metal transporter [Sporosarcina newyorkensis]EGQ26452.1 NRAMP family metal ion transporter [Sporosarcina newyorkensis 2681]SKA98204.1 NRAMP (natural resistance-associated macrophage protein) metal ion transporters [Sporosarcina newyorkensis]